MLDFRLLGSLGIVLEDDRARKLQAYHELLLAHSRQMDLTKVPEEEMTIRHYADSLLVLKHLAFKAGARLIDVGSGAGFPGLPLAIARPDMAVCLLDSRQKRCEFLQTVVDTLGLENVSLLCGRAEDLALPPNRETFDFAAARAVAPLNELLEYLLPFVQPGGQALCWKGPALREELAQGARAASLLGGLMGELIDLGIPGRSHYVQIIDKLGATPKKYPRKAGTPGKEPLGLKP